MTLSDSLVHRVSVVFGCSGPTREIVDGRFDRNLLMLRVDCRLYFEWFDSDHSLLFSDIHR